MTVYIYIFMFWVKIPIFLQICYFSFSASNLEDYTIRIHLSRFYVYTAPQSVFANIPKKPPKECVCRSYGRQSECYYLSVDSPFFFGGRLQAFWDLILILHFNTCFLVIIFFCCFNFNIMFLLA